MASIFCVKFSILEFYKRSFQTVNITRAISVTKCFVAAWAVAFFFVAVFGTWPIAANWDISVNASRRVNWHLLYVLLCATDALADAMILCLPLFTIRKLRMSARNKLAMAGVFTLGGL